MAKRSYEQYCPLARSLDLLGERWTLLIVRDLIAGPKRYTDLQRGLPGLATDLLTDRLRKLERAGVVRRRELSPPAPATVYPAGPARPSSPTPRPCTTCSSGGSTPRRRSPPGASGARETRVRSAGC